MHLLEQKSNGKFSLTEFFEDNIPPYAILSHTWGDGGDEVTLKDLKRAPVRARLAIPRLNFVQNRLLLMAYSTSGSTLVASINQATLGLRKLSILCFDKDMELGNTLIVNKHLGSRQKG